jgi:iron complex outermembrane receptor protein
MVRTRTYRETVGRVRKLAVCSATGLLLWGTQVLGADLVPAELQKTAAGGAPSGVELTAFQPQAPAAPTPAAAPTPPNVPSAPTTTLEPVEVVAEPPAPVNLTPQLPAPTNAFADTVFDSPFFAAPVQGYAAGSSTTAAKINIPNIDFPGIVNTVTQDLIRDRQIVTFENALRNVPNVIPRTGAGFRSDEFYIRGFNVGFSGNDFRKDGFRDSSWVNREVQNIERIEVLKGPASTIYGAASTPAGLINVVTKKPLNERFAFVNAQFGSYDFFRQTADVNTPLFGSDDLLSRTNIAVQESDSFRDFVFVDRVFWAQAFTWNLSDDTSLTFLGEYLHDSRMTDRGLVFYPNTPAGDPFAMKRRTFLGQPTDRNNYEDGQFNLFLNHAFNDRWQARLGYVGNWSGEQRNNYDTRGVVGNNATRQFVLQRSIAQDQYFIGDLTGDIAGPLWDHKVLVGTELGTTINDTFSRNSVVTGFPINIFDPFTTPGANYSLYPQTPTLAAAQTNGLQQDNYGVYFQDLIEFSPYLKGLVGFRSSWTNQKGFSNATQTYQEFDAITPRYGLVLEPLPGELSYYVAYSETFNPVTGLRAGPTPGSTEPLDPEAGWGFDLGTKMLLKENLWLNVGYFDIERTNVVQAVTPPTNPPTNVQFGMVRSTGMEVELVGDITERWSIINGYGMADARIERDRVPTNVGKHLTNSPYWQGNLWTRYNFVQRPERVIGLGFGMYYTDFWHISADNLYSLPGYTRFDLGFFNDFRRLKSSLYIENLTNEIYASGANGSTTVLPGAPITLRGNIGFAF